MNLPEPAPVFILGLHRSGTTILYEMLASTGAFEVLTAWHVIEFEQIRAGHVLTNDAEAVDRSRAELSRRMEAMGLATRGLDGVRASPDTPEEYGFILANHGHGPRLTRLNRPLFKALCGYVGGTGPERRPILLKNTWDFANIELIHQLVPQGRFICIHRHPHAVLTSMFRAAQSMLGAYNPYVGLLSRSYRRFALSPPRSFLIQRARHGYAAGEKLR